MKEVSYIQRNPMTPKDAWDSLSIADKTAMMRVAVQNGITNLDDIRQKYNEFAEGGNIYDDGGYKPSEGIKKRISKWEGKAMTGAKDPLSGKFLKNNSFESEAAAFTQALPESIRDQVLSNPELADNLFSYSYNVGAPRFKQRVVKALEDYYAGKGTAKKIADSMWASGDIKLRGLRNRREEEKQGVLNALRVVPHTITEQPVSTVVVNPFIIPAENTTFFPQVTPVKDNYVEVQEITPEQRRAEQVRNTFDVINNYNIMMDMLSVPNNPQPMYVPKNAPYVVRGLSGPIVEAAMNEYKKGGGIHIKHPGRLTALKKRTGKTEAELYNDGNPAHKKMVVFARNARKWKHEDGGNLFSGEEEGSQQMITTHKPYYDRDGMLLYNRTLPETVVTGKNKHKGIFNSIWDAIKDTDAAYIENPSVMTAAGHTAKISGTHAPTKEERKLADNLGIIGLAGATSLVAPTVLPQILTPGSSFWMNPITKQMVTGTAMSEGVNLANKAVNGYNTVGEGVGDLVEQATGWNPNNTWLGPLVTEAFNPGWYWSPNSVMGAVGKVSSATENGIDKAMNAWRYRGTNAGNTPRGLLVDAKPLIAKGTPDIANGSSINYQENITDNLLRWLGRTSDYKPQVPITQKNDLYFQFMPEQRRMLELWKDTGVDIKRIGAEDIENAFTKRMQALRGNDLERYTIARPIGDKGFSLGDYVTGRERPVGEIDLEIADDGTTLMADIHNYTRNSPIPVRHVQERGLNSAINTSKSIGGDGVIAGREYQSAPRQYHTVQKYHDRELVGRDGQHYNSNMVNDYETVHDLPRTYDETIIPQDKELWKGMLELARAGEKERKILFGAPYWKLKTPTYHTPTKSTLFNPTIIDSNGNMLIDWNDTNIFRSYGGYIIR